MVMLQVIAVALIGMSLVISSLAISEELFPEPFGCTVTMRIGRIEYEQKSYPVCEKMEEIR